MVMRPFIRRCIRDEKEKGKDVCTFAFIPEAGLSCPFLFLPIIQVIHLGMRLMKELHGRFSFLRINDC